MTQRLYYTDPTLLEFDAQVLEFTPAGDRIRMVLDRSAFYPTSGGQLYDKGWVGRESDEVRLRVSEVEESDDGGLIHYVDPAGMQIGIARGSLMHFVVDRHRRRDHMEQHTGQHLLSAVFIELVKAPTVSFHMGDETCTIDLDTKSLSDEQVRRAETSANEIVLEDASVTIRFATPDEARVLGVRKIPEHVEGKLRLIEIKGHDLNACGGTHVSRTGEIGAILLRKVEKVKKGVRVEFVCGGRAVATARKDFDTLTSAAALFSSHIYDVPAQIRKAIDEAKSARKREFKLQEELTEFVAVKLVSEAPERSRVRVVRKRFNDCDLAYIRLLAQRIARQPNAVALLACTQPQPSLVFAQSLGAAFDMGAFMKEAMASLGGRGGGAHDLAQGGAPAGADLDAALDAALARIPA
jgi:alanyl-tRNA synthetase